MRRTLGVVDGIAILIGITIGAGIYSTPQIIAIYQSSFYVIISLWIGTGLFAFIGGLIYAELGTRLPRTGGEYVYITQSFGSWMGFLFGWAQLFIIRTSPAAGLALITADYLGYFVHLSPWQHTGTALLTIALLGGLNYTGIRKASLYQRASTFLKVTGLLFLTLMGLAVLISSWVGLAPDSTVSYNAPVQSGSGPLARFSATMMLIVFSYLGWDRVGYVAEEMRNPRKVVPLSMFFGIGTIVVIYTSINWLYHRTLGLEGVRGATIVASDTAVVLLGSVGAGFVALLVILSATGSTNGTMMTAPRVYYAMARDGLFFSWFNYVHPRFLTPSRAVLAHVVWAAVILLVRQQFESIVAGMAFAVLIFYALTTVALFRLRKANAGEQDCYKVPFYPVLPGIYLVGICLLIGLRIVFEFEKSIVDLLFLASGIPFAFFWTRRSSRRH